jgi:hypothetical protein
MRRIQLNTDIVEQKITWGREDKIEIPMPPRNHWTRDRLLQFTQSKAKSKKEKSADGSSVGSKSDSSDGSVPELWQKDDDSTSSGGSKSTMPKLLPRKKKVQFDLDEVKSGQSQIRSPSQG